MILKRYIVMEILKPAGAILFVLVVIFTSYTAVTYLSEAVAGSLPASTVGLMILYRLGMALEVLLPITFYLSVIIALGRLYKDSEMTALAACGVGIGGVLKPVAVLAIPVAALAGWASMSIRPQSYVEIYRLKAQAQVEFDISRLEPDNFLDLQNGKYVFFAETVKERRNGAGPVFIRIKEGGTRKVIQAERMVQGPEDESGAKSLRFSHGTLYEFPVSGEGGKVSQFDEAEYPIPNDPPGERYRYKAAPTRDLIGSTNPEDISELQWRLSTPLSTLLLAIVGVPLSKSNPRRGKYAKLGVAIIIFAFYYQLFVIARTWVEKGKVIPLIGIWWVPLLLTILAAVLLWRTGELFYRVPRSRHARPA